MPAAPWRIARHCPLASWPLCRRQHRMYVPGVHECSCLALHRHPDHVSAAMSNLDILPGSLYFQFMEVRLSPDQESALRQVAATTGRDPEALVQDAVDQLLDYDRWFREQVQIGLAQADRGELVTHEEVGERIGRLFRS